MASNKNDMLNTRTVSGSVNLYDEQKCIGNAEDKTIAAMLGGHSFNIVHQSLAPVFLSIVSIDSF